MSEPLEPKPPIMFLLGMLIIWPLSDNGHAPLRPIVYSTLMGTPRRFLGLPEDRDRLSLRTQEAGHAAH